MKVITATKAQGILSNLLEETVVSHKPVQITSGSSKGVLMAEEDWRSIQETLYLLSIPGMRESIREGMDSPVDECATELSW